MLNSVQDDHTNLDHLLRFSIIDTHRFFTEYIFSMFDHELGYWKMFRIYNADVHDICTEGIVGIDFVDVKLPK